MKAFLVLVLFFCGVSNARPLLNVYHYDFFQNEIGGFYHEKIQETKRAHRLFQRLTGQKVRLRIQQIEGVLLDVYFGCLFWSSTSVGCIESLHSELLLKRKYRANGTAHYFVLPPIKHQGSFWIGGAAITDCWKNIKRLRAMNVLAGIGFGNFLRQQNTGTTRIPQSVAVMMHEWGHLLLGLSHDVPEENYLMNSLFNVKGFSSQSAPELWRISEKSKREIRRCRGA